VRGRRLRARGGADRVGARSGRCPQDDRLTARCLTMHCRWAQHHATSEASARSSCAPPRCSLPWGCARRSRRSRERRARQHVHAAQSHEHLLGTRPVGLHREYVPARRRAQLGEQALPGMPTQMSRHTEPRLLTRIRAFSRCLTIHAGVHARSLILMHHGAH
jgi:hypothetical protein